MATYTHAEGTPVVWASGTYSSTASGLSKTSGADLDLIGVLTTEAREGDKVDLGATRAPIYAVRVGIEMNAPPTAGLTVDYYWSSSFSATAATGNDGGASGTDGDYKNAEEDEWAKQLYYLGSLVLTADSSGTNQFGTIGYFSPPHRYGMPVVHNKSGQTLFTTDSNEMFFALIPLVHGIA